MEIINIDTDRVLKTLEKKINTSNIGCYFVQENSYYNSSSDFCYTFCLFIVPRTQYSFFYDFLPNNYLLQSNASVALEILKENECYYVGGTDLEDLIAESIFQAFFKKWVSIILPPNN